VCKGCGLEVKLIKAHAIPESFFVGLRDGQTPPRLMTDTSGVYPQKSPIGVYDNGILCRSCEDRFQEVDDYGQNLLLKQEETHVELKHSSGVVGYQVENVNYNLLKLFFVSILCRASISNHAFYSKVNLGAFEADAKNLIWNSNPGAIDQFSFVLSKFTDRKLGRSILDPHRERWHGINYQRFYMYGYVLYIKVDRRPSPAILKPFEFNSDGTLYIVGRDIHKSAEYPVLVSVVNKARN
jgi:hypothetical protein